jgi:hypothetical protein
MKRELDGYRVFRLGVHCPIFRGSDERHGEKSETGGSGELGLPGTVECLH